MDGKHVVFGRVIEGFTNGVFHKIENVKKGANDRPVEPVVIADCGLYDPKQPPPPFEGFGVVEETLSEDTGDL